MIMVNNKKKKFIERNSISKVIQNISIKIPNNKSYSIPNSSIVSTVTKK